MCFSFQAPMEVKVYKLLCNSGECCIPYCGSKDCLHFFSRQTCAGDEIAYDFVNRVISTKTSFSSYCSDMTRVYKSSYEGAGSFMSPGTFIKWFFSWAAAKKIDFRKEIDPWCGHNPQILAADATHVGVAIKHLSISPIETIHSDEVRLPQRRRNDRCFFEADHPPSAISLGMEKLLKSCNSLLQRSSVASSTLLTSDVDDVLRVVPQSVCLVVHKFLSRQYPQDVLRYLAEVLLLLSCKYPVSQLLPYRYVAHLREFVQHIKDTGNLVNASEVMQYAPEILKLLTASVRREDFVMQEMCDFVHSLCVLVESVHADDVAAGIGSPIVGSYNPEKFGCAYYFSPHGCRVRLPLNYSGSANPTVEAESCTKIYPFVSRGGFTYSFLWFCPIHGHCYGFHLIPGSEGRKDAFFSLYSYLPEPPKEIFYDFGCSLAEYCLNREPGFFRETRFWHDIFHGFSHKCPRSFNSSRIPMLSGLNTEICEQFNAFLQCIKYTGSHLTQTHFCFFLQFFISIWNSKKTLLTNQKFQLAAACMQ